jgi:hypothetical protein
MPLFAYVIISVAVLGLIGLLIALVASRLAPEGYQDESGFQYAQSTVGAENSASPFQGVVSGSR